MLVKSFSLLVICMCLVRFSYAYFIKVDAHTEECLFEKVEAGTKMNLTFEVTEGGFLDIDLRIVGPDGKVIYKVDGESSGNYTFAAHTRGDFTYCFANKISIAPKIVEFYMVIGEPPKTNATCEAETATKLKDI